MMRGRGAAIGWMVGHDIRNVDDAEAAWGHSSLFSGWRPQWVLHLLEVLPSLVGLCAQTNHSSPFWAWLSSLGGACGRRNTSQSDQTGNYCLLPLPKLPFWGVKRPRAPVFGCLCWRSGDSEAAQGHLSSCSGKEIIQPGDIGGRISRGGGENKNIPTLVLGFSGQGGRRRQTEKYQRCWQTLSQRGRRAYKSI